MILLTLVGAVIAVYLRTRLVFANQEIDDLYSRYHSLERRIATIEETGQAPLKIFRP